MKRGNVGISIIAAMAVFCAAAPVFAQDAKASTSKELTIEELFLKSVKFQVLKEKAFSGEREAKVSALNDLEKMINDGAIGDNGQQAQFILEYLSLEGTLHTVREEKRLVNYFPDVRMRACALLGKLGTKESQRALITVLLSDVEPMVKAEAVYGIGTIGLNDDDEAATAIAFALNKEDPVAPDNNFAFAACLALEKLGKKGVIKKSTAYETLVKIAFGKYNNDTRAKAQAILGEMDK